MSRDARDESRTPGLDEWLSWPVEDVAAWVSSRERPVVLGWPFNGTRRWYLLYRREHPEASDYMTALISHQAAGYRTAFAHGVGVILSPGFGAELLRRGPEYTRTALGGLLQLADDPIYQEMFAEGVRLRFYGDYEELLDTPTFRPMLRACREITDATASGDGPLLMIGLFADAPYPTIARLSVEFADKHSRPPNRQELIEAYYGVPVPDLSLYLGFAQPALFDVPMVATGEEDLYATLTPSPHLTEAQLREILYDHLITRRTPDPDYETLSERAKDSLAEYNNLYSGETLGVGRIDPLTGIWNPVLPPSTDDWRHET